jgi:hypothetical protein
MVDYKTLTVGELAAGIAETRAAIERATALIEKIGKLGAQKPAVWAALADSTARLREHLTDDIDALEKALNTHIS